MKVFTHTKAGVSSVILAYNKGHAVKILSQALKSKGIELGDDLVHEIDLDAEKKGKVIFIEEQS